MREGDVALSPFQQVDGKTKNRPAVVLRIMPQFGDLLVCGISRQLRHRVEDFDEVIATTDSDFASSGLVDTSLIRLGFLALLRAARFLAPSVPFPLSGIIACYVVFRTTFKGAQTSSKDGWVFNAVLPRMRAP